MIRSRRLQLAAVRLTALRAAALLAATLPVMIPDQVGAQEAESYSIAGDQVAVYNLAGSVRLEAGTGASVVVEVRRGGSDAAKLEIERQNVNGRAALVVRYPDDNIVYTGREWSGRTTMHVRDDGTFGDVRGGGERVSIRSSGSGLEAHADLRILVPAGRSVAVRLGVGEVVAANIGGDLDIDVSAASVQTTGTRGALRIDTGSGSVRVSQAEGDVNVDTGSGSVRVNDVRGNELLVDTGSGSVTGSNINAGRVHVDTGSGSIQLASVAARDLNLDTGSGSVELDLTTDVDELRIDTGSGGVRLKVPGNLGAEVEIETGSGGITTDDAMSVTRRQRNHVQGRLGDGRGTIMIETGSGGVRIARR